jgi:hypothetical protein
MDGKIDDKNENQIIPQEELVNILKETMEKYKEDFEYLKDK